MRPRVSFAMQASKTRHVFDDAALARLDACCEVLSRVPIEDFEAPEAREQLAKTDVLVTGWGCGYIGSDVLRMAPGLKLIAHAAGTVKYMVDPAVYDAGVSVCHAAEANAVPVAEYTLAAIIFANKRVFELRDCYQADHSRKSSWKLMDEPIGNYRRTVGLIGASRIGRRVASMLELLDVDVLLADPFVTQDDPVTKQARLVDLETLLKQSDIVSLHAPALPSTHHMLSRRQFRLMRDGATFINTARGMLVDEDALLDELESGRIHAIIDVTHPEIPDDDSRFYTLPNVFLTPHVAGAAGTERLRLGEMAVAEVERFAKGQPLEYAIEPELLERLA
ncbi:dehydrogenase [Devosia pacifica]|uniref:Dehydrogenase n=2 Tax=Devosia pacifica TaxID=1335967 RepID=A0A918SB47_9HYPH|nr:dehydrogenase [Devosia pacifica]